MLQKVVKMQLNTGLTKLALFSVISYFCEHNEKMQIAQVKFFLEFQ